MDRRNIGAKLNECLQLLAVARAMRCIPLFMREIGFDNRNQAQGLEQFVLERRVDAVTRTPSASRLSHAVSKRLADTSFAVPLHPTARHAPAQVDAVRLG